MFHPLISGCKYRKHKSLPTDVNIQSHLLYSINTLLFSRIPGNSSSLRDARGQCSLLQLCAVLQAFQSSFWLGDQLTNRQLLSIPQVKKSPHTSKPITNKKDLARTMQIVLI
jgi:hypothetical protein